MKRFSIVGVLGVLGVLASVASGQAGMLSASAQGQFVSVPDSASLVPTSGFTLEAWIRFTGAFSQGAPTIARKNANTPAYLLRLENNGTKLVSYVNKSGSLSVLEVNVASLVNSWQHVAMTYDGITQRLFLNGSQVGTLSAVGTLTNQPGPLKIGEGAGDGNEQFTGSIDEVRLWSVTRTAAQIQATRFIEIGPTPGLVSSWRMNGSFTDAIGSNNGIPIGGVTTVASTSPVLSNQVLGPASVPIGSVLMWFASCMEAGDLYVFDISVTGTTPGVTLPPPYTATIPLNPPWIYNDLGPSLPPSLFSNFVGVVPATFTFNPSLSIPALQSLVGLPVSASYVALDSVTSLITAIGAPSTTIIGNFAPIVQSVAPPTAVITGGSQATITGSNFQPGATVQIDGVLATNVVVASPTAITLTLPPSQLGPATVTVFNPDGISGSNLTVLTYVPILVVTDVLPEPPVPGGVATLFGAGFLPSAMLTVNGAVVTPLSIQPTQISFTTPPSLPCSSVVGVVTPESQIGLADWNVPPHISSVLPASGSQFGGQTFFLFGSFPPSSTVSVGGVSGTIVASTPTALLVQAPPNPVGPVSVVVTSPTGCTGTGTYTYQ